MTTTINISSDIDTIDKADTIYEVDAINETPTKIVKTTKCAYYELQIYRHYKAIIPIPQPPYITLCKNIKIYRNKFITDITEAPTISHELKQLCDTYSCYINNNYYNIPKKHSSLYKQAEREFVVAVRKFYETHNNGRNPEYSDMIQAFVYIIYKALHANDIQHICIEYIYVIVILGKIKMMHILQNPMLYYVIRMEYSEIWYNLVDRNITSRTYILYE